MAGNLWVQETTLSKRDDGNCLLLGESAVYETFTGDRGELYRSLVKANGRCTGKVYVDRAGGAVAIGWVFEARRPYEDDPSQSSLIETWVTVHTAPPTVTTEYHYAGLRYTRR